MFTLTVLIVVAVACLIIGAIGGPSILKLLADVKGDIRKEYETVIADLTAAKTKAEAALAPAIAAVKADYDKVVADLTTRATQAEAGLAAIKQYLAPPQAAVVPVAQMPTTTTQLTPAEQAIVLAPPAPTQPLDIDVAQPAQPAPTFPPYPPTPTV